MRKVLIIALGLLTLGALVGAQPADARKKGPSTPTGIGGGKPPAGPRAGASQVVVVPTELNPRHLQPTDPALFKK